MESNSVNIIIVDDHPVVIEGLKALLLGYSFINVLGCFTSSREAISFLEVNSCDIIFLDISLPDISGIELCAIIQKEFPKIKVIGISTYSESSMINQMIKNGARGYVLKNASADELISAIKAVSNGKVYFSTDIQKVLIEANFKDDEATPQLTRREKEVLLLIAEGHTTQQIADRLFVSPLTIETHRRNLMQKFNVSNSPSLIKYAYEKNLIE